MGDINTTKPDQSTSLGDMLTALKALRDGQAKTAPNSTETVADMLKALTFTSDPVGMTNKLSSLPGYEWGPNGVFAGQTVEGRRDAMVNHTGAYAPSIPEQARQDFNHNAQPEPANSPLDLFMRQDNAPKAVAAHPYPWSPESQSIYGQAGAAGASPASLGLLMKSLLAHEKIQQLIKKPKPTVNSAY